jgi:hypothetical protein
LLNQIRKKGQIPLKEEQEEKENGTQETKSK